MRFVMSRLWGILRDDRGGEIMEYAIVAGLISIAALGLIASFGTKVLAKWTSVNSSM